VSSNWTEAAFLIIISRCRLFKFLYNLFCGLGRITDIKPLKLLIYMLLFLSLLNYYHYYNYIWHDPETCSVLCLFSLFYFIFFLFFVLFYFILFLFIYLFYWWYFQFILFTCHAFLWHILSVFLHFELTCNVGLLTAEVHVSIIPVNT